MLLQSALITLICPEQRGPSVLDATSGCSCQKFCMFIFGSSEISRGDTQTCKRRFACICCCLIVSTKVNGEDVTFPSDCPPNITLRGPRSGQGLSRCTRGKGQYARAKDCRCSHGGYCTLIEESTGKKVVEKKWWRLYGPISILWTVSFVS